jgi:hypothetical protein
VRNILTKCQTLMAVLRSGPSRWFGISWTQIYTGKGMIPESHSQSHEHVPVAMLRASMSFCAVALQERILRDGKVTQLSRVKPSFSCFQVWIYPYDSLISETMWYLLVIWLFMICLISICYTCG